MTEPNYTDAQIEEARRHVEIVIRSSHLPGWEKNREAWDMLNTALSERHAAMQGQRAEVMHATEYAERLARYLWQLTTPAQTVDIEAVREVLEQMRLYLKSVPKWKADIDKLSQAIGDKP